MRAQPNTPALVPPHQTGREKPKGPSPRGKNDETPENKYRYRGSALVRVVHHAWTQTKPQTARRGKLPYHAVCGNEAVGAPGFEPGTSRTQTVRASQLRYAPNISDYNAKYPFCQSDAKRSSSIPRSTVVIR